MRADAPEGGPGKREGQRGDRQNRRGRDLVPLFVVPLLGIVCLLLAAQLAVMPARVWQAPASMLSEMDPDQNYRSGEVYIEPLRPEIMTPQPWDPVLILTPGGEVEIVPPLVFVPIPTATPRPVAEVTATPTPRPPLPSLTHTPTPLPPTPTPVPPTPTPIPPTPTPTIPPTLTPTPTSTPVPPTPPSPPPTPTPIPPTPTPTPVPPTPTPTFTPIPPTPTPTPTPPAPLVFSISPNTYVNTTPVSVTITGEYFQPGCSAALGPIPLSVTACLSTTIEALVPADLPAGSFPAGFYDLTVTNPDSQSAMLTNAYTATNPIPVITQVRPALSTGTVTEVITITGSLFRTTGAPGALEVRLDGVGLSDLTFISESMLTATVPGGLPLGGYTLYVTNPGPTAPTGSLDNAFSIYAPPTVVTCTNGIPATDCQELLNPPDGGIVEFDVGEVITVDFGTAGITDGPGYDLVFYEWENPPGYIQMDYLRVEVSPDGSSWTTVFEWNGDNPGDVVGTNIDAYAADGEVENEMIPSSGLYPSNLPNNTGIAIDLNPLGLAGPFRYVRFTDPGGSDPSQIDAVLRLH